MNIENDNCKIEIKDEPFEAREEEASFGYREDKPNSLYGNMMQDIDSFLVKEETELGSCIYIKETQIKEEADNGETYFKEEMVIGDIDFVETGSEVKQENRMRKISEEKIINATSFNEERKSVSNSSLNSPNVENDEHLIMNLEQNKEISIDHTETDSSQQGLISNIFFCSLCEFQSEIADCLKGHLLSHTKMLFKCSACNYSCNHKCNLKMHSVIQSNTQLYKCNECDYTSNRKDSLRSHILVHSLAKLYKCHECDYSCNHKRSLKIHALTHSDTKLHKCSECDYATNWKGDLKKHILCHSDTKMFKCNECDYACNQKGNLYLHSLTHSKTKLFKCTECDYGCNRKSSFKIHVLTHRKL